MIYALSQRKHLIILNNEVRPSKIRKVIVNKLSSFIYPNFTPHVTIPNFAKVIYLYMRLFLQRCRFYLSPLVYLEMISNSHVLFQDSSSGLLVIEPQYWRDGDKKFSLRDRCSTKVISWKMKNCTLANFHISTFYWIYYNDFNLFQGTSMYVKL